MGDGGTRQCKGANGAELLCNGGKVSAAGGRERTEYGGVKKTVQKCKSAYGLCKSGKVKSDYRVRSTDYGGKVGTWLRRVLLG